MARRAGEAKLDSASARRRFEAWHGVRWNVIAAGCYLGYRRGTSTKAGTWYAKYVASKDAQAGIAESVRRLQERLGAADDFLPANNVTILDYVQARKKAAEWFSTALTKATGAVPQRRDYTVACACSDYLRTLEEARSRSHYGTSTMVDRNIIPHLGTVGVEKLTRTRIEKWLNMLVDKPRRKPGNSLEPDSDEAVRRRRDTANRNLTVLKAALNRSLADGKVAGAGLAWRQVKPFKGVGQPRTRFLTDDESRKLVTACGPEFRLLVQAALYSGCRYSELGRLQAFDFDIASGTLLITQSKSDKPRRIYCDDEAARFFAVLCAKRRGHDIMLTIDGHAWRKDDAKGLMAEVTKAAAIDACTFHELRHTAASRWARQGLTLAEIARQLGHGSDQRPDIRMTLRYAHLCEQTLANKVRSMRPLGIFQEAEQITSTIQ